MHPHPAPADLQPDPAADLTSFLARLGHDPQADAAASIRAACDFGYGVWITPDAPCTPRDTLMRRPATHLHEVTLFGISATGDTPRAVAAHWLTVARRILAAQAEQATEQVTEHGWAA